MLFNSYEFIFLFLPLSLIFFSIIRTYGKLNLILSYIIFISLVFYSWWNPKYCFLILGSIGINYLFAKIIHKTNNKPIFMIGIAVNLLVLIYYKYALYLAGFIFTREEIPDFIQTIVLPLAISFFTFQQISYLIDIYKGRVTPNNLFEYSASVLFFPHLIAGPIIRYQDIYKQFNKLENKSDPYQHYLIGIIVFVIGLFKKTCIADQLIPIVEKTFERADTGYAIGFIDAWLASIGYTFQLYFDFSGYSEMAIGLGYMFGILLPVNFNSPYKACSIIDFWRRWHISLSEFFKDYLYIPLGGNRVSIHRQFLNLFIVMGLVGLWHGAGNTFLIWGIYHGMLLVFNHLYQAIKKSVISMFPNKKNTNVYISRLYTIICWLLTFISVLIGWVMFRSKDFVTAKAIYMGMLFRSDWIAGAPALLDYRLYYYLFYPLTLVCFLVVIFFPNTIELMSSWKIALNQTIIEKNIKPVVALKWDLNLLYTLVCGIFIYFAVANINSVQTEFLYFNF